MAGGQGLEPRLHAPKARVLPLDDPPMYLTFARILEKANKFKVKFINVKVQPYYFVWVGTQRKNGVLTDFVIVV